jgi:CheY-like chemotaxis protein
VSRILIVENSTIYRQLLNDMLHHQFPSVDILEVADGEEALRKIDTFFPDLVFMDIKLPGINGLELTKTIKDQYPSLPIVILTAYDLPEYREAARWYKADYFLAKGPATKTSISTMVGSILSVRCQDRSSLRNGDLSEK